MNTATAETTDPVTMTCICGTEHTFAPGEGSGECGGCGLGLVLCEEVTVVEEPRECSACHGSGIGRSGDPDTSRCAECHGSGEARTSEGEDDEPYDIDDDRFTNPYTGGAEDDGYDTGCFDD